jgi:hypothetical protein
VYSLYDEHVVSLLEEAFRHVEQRASTGQRFRTRRAAAGTRQGGG